MIFILKKGVESSVARQDLSTFSDPRSEKIAQVRVRLDSLKPRTDYIKLSHESYVIYSTIQLYA